MNKTDLITYPEEIKSLPINPYLDEICEKLKSSESRFLVLTAETAAGKSTAVPLALLRHFPGKILMLEPRRLAVTAIAERVASLLGEESGETAGYRLHLDSKVSAKTRFEVITEAILIRRLQKDPLLEDINVVVLDEFHERSVYADLALAFLKEAMSVRDDLFVIVMSATIDSRTLVEYLDAPLMKVPGRQFPVEIQYKDNLSVVSAIKNCLYEKTGDKKDSILVFLPGIYEIKKTLAELKETLSEDDAEILILHSSVPLSEQRKVLIPSKEKERRRIILSSAIAETSLTVPDVTVVIDSGLSRINRTNVRLGINQLVTEASSLFSAEQRAGRAGRVAPGKCIRLWNKNEVRPLKNEPEILRLELTEVVLECAKWGVADFEKLSWLDEPSKSAWNSAVGLLENLGCIKNGLITPKGEDCLSLPLHPRLACVALCGEKAVPTVVKFSEYADKNLDLQKKFIEDLKLRLKKCHKTQIQVDSEANFLLEGFCDRVGKLTEVSNSKSIYQFPSGRKALLDKINGPAWIIAPEIDAGSVIGRIYSYSPLKENEIINWLNERSVVYTKSEFMDNSGLKLNKTEFRAFGKIILQKKKLIPQLEDFKEAVSNIVAEKGIEWLSSDSQVEAFLLRAEFYAQDNEEIKEKLKELKNTTNEWLLSFINSPTINSKIVYEGLYWYLNGSEIDQKVPSQITLPNGKKRKLIYEKQNNFIKPVLEVIIQQIFGCFETPKILGRPVLLKLLSPARRPLQITEDLEHFWTGAWLEICKEMKSRYPKHNWDYRKPEEGE